MAASETHRLKRYREKRDFSQTPEPHGGGASAKWQYVIQQHAARRLHYDFRIALNGVLLSWAVTRGPSLNPEHKRLAVRTEDHPLAYADFEGVIPAGYGAGTVLLWDRGKWEPIGDPEQGLARGVLKFRLEGERLRGGFALVRMGQDVVGDRQNWLLIKERDDQADSRLDPLTHWTTSVKTGRDLGTITAGHTAGGDDPPAGTVRRAAKGISCRRGKAISPGFIPPQLATLSTVPPAGPGWVHEIKFDGYRIQAMIDDGVVRLVTRNGLDWTAHYPTVAKALSQIAVRSAILDGELIAFDRSGHARFSALQKAAGGKDSALAYYAFDILHLDGEEWRARPLHERKAALAELLAGASLPLRFSEAIKGSGAQVLEKACAMGLEGIVSKRIDAPYRSGRSRLWIKIKCHGNDEFVIGGYRRSRVRGRAFASLLVGEYQGDRLLYRGRVGTGFDQAALDHLGSRFPGLERSTPPFHTLPADARAQAVWLDPQLIAQIRYAERTGDGLLRHPSYLGLRQDKAPQEVSMQAESLPDECMIQRVKLTHPKKVMYPRQGITKQDLARYYAEYAARILPFLKNRPFSLLRCPEGRQGACFFQKHEGNGLLKQIKSIMISEKDSVPKPYLLIRDPAGLVAAVQYGALELHPWGARADRLERPERVVFDLDPAEDVPFAVVRESAFELHDVLASAGLTSFALLTGGKGIHVVVPIMRRHTWTEVKAFARGLAEALVVAAPDRYVAQAAKHKRAGKIFIDWLRNERGATAIAPYSTRARAGAPIATPVDWDELRTLESANCYDMGTIKARLARLASDPWAGYHTVRQSISKRTLEQLAWP